MEKMKMMDSKVRIGIDFHGVITEAPAFFRDFTALAIERNYEVHIISGGPYSVEKNFLDSWKIQYTQIFSLLDYFAARGQVEYFANGNFKVPDVLWDKAKAEYCLQHNINIQIDDTFNYGKSFSTPFCLYNAATATCEVGGKTIDFSKSPAEALDAIEQFMNSRN